MSHLTHKDQTLITTFGRLVEAQAGASKSLGHSLEHHIGISHAWFEVLLRVSRADGGRISMGALAQQVTLTSGGITRLIDRMVDAGLVQRVPCPSDRRVQFATLTRRGRSTFEAAATLHATNLRRLFAGFSAQDLRTLDLLLDRLRSADLDSFACGVHVAR